MHKNFCVYAWNQGLKNGRENEAFSGDGGDRWESREEAGLSCF